MYIKITVCINHQITKKKIGTHIVTAIFALKNYNYSIGIFINKFVQIYCKHTKINKNN